MAIVGLLNFKADNEFYFDAVEQFSEQCRSVNLLINAKKTKEMVLSFSRTYAIYDYLFINSQPIEKAEHFKYLGTYFSHDLKWHENTCYTYKKLRARFYCFSKFKQFDPSKSQKHDFIETLILPIFMYNIELWYFSATQGNRDKLLRLFFKNTHFFDADSLVCRRIENTAKNFINFNTHILNGCYSFGRKSYRMPKIKTERFLCSFIPTSIKVLNDMPLQSQSLF